MRSALALAGCLLVHAAAAPPYWQIQPSPGPPADSVALVDFQFFSASHGIAVGRRNESGVGHAAALVTQDGGKTWTWSRLPASPRSVFFLNDSLGWLVTDHGIWRTLDGGETWRNLKGPAGIERVYFVEEAHGWAVGTNKQMLESFDRGATWVSVDAGAKPDTRSETTTYGWIDFATSRAGLISGWTLPPRQPDRKESGEPLEEERSAQRKPLLPSISILLDTKNGGVDWRASTASMFGRISRVRLAPDGRGLGLIEFNDSFEWPSEVFRINWRTGESARVFRQQDQGVTDMAFTGEDAFLAAIQFTTTPRDSSVPGLLRVFRSTDLAEWTASPVGGKIPCRRAFLSAPPGGHIWLLTDTGYVLKLVPE